MRRIGVDGTRSVAGNIASVVFGLKCKYFKPLPKRVSLNNRVTESLQFVYGVPYENVSTQTLDASTIPLFQGVQVTCLYSCTGRYVSQAQYSPTASGAGGR